MATSSATKSSLVLVLLLSAVVASHAAHEVSCKNSCKDTIWLNGIEVPAGEKIIVELEESLLEIVCEVIGLDGVKHTGKYECPKDVKELEFLYDTVKHVLVVKVIAVLRLLGVLVGTVLGLVKPVVECILHS